MLRPAAHTQPLHVQENTHKSVFLFVFSSPGLYGLPKRNGKLKDITKFDATFFGVHPKQANTMDPQLRVMLEVSYEAIVDGGVDATAKTPLTILVSNKSFLIYARLKQIHQTTCCRPEPR